MTTARPAGSRPRRRRLRAVLLAVSAFAVAATVIALGVVGASERASGEDAAASAAGAGAHGSAAVGIRSFVAPTDISTVANVQYTTADGTAQRLDVCLPATTGTNRPAVLVVHGGAWTHGDKSSTDWHPVCQWLASEGFVTFSADYSLVPQARFPVAVDELASAIAWMRTSSTVARFGIDPKHIGVFGGSAGGSMAALLATRGSGPTDRGTRVAALAEISGPVDLTAQGQTLGHPGAGIQRIELDYLGCSTFANCPQAATASAITHVDSSDPPTFIQGSEGDFVPHEQGQAFAAALARAGVPQVSRVVPGDAHSIAELDAPTRAAIAAFLHRYLG